MGQWNFYWDEQGPKYLEEYEVECQHSEGKIKEEDELHDRIKIP